jgi:hypothetical protein
MCGDQDSSDQADRVCDFCGSVNLKLLQADGIGLTPSARYVCWLDERASDGDETGSRVRCLPLTAWELYTELSKPVSFRTLFSERLRCTKLRPVINLVCC